MPAFQAVLGEDPSDAEAVAVSIRRLRDAIGLPRIKIKRQGYEGCGQLMRKGARQLKAWEQTGCTRAVVCHDSDRNIPDEVRQRVESEIIKKSGVKIRCLALVPVQEVEAWFLADAGKLDGPFHWCAGLSAVLHPETINDPKEYICRISREPDTKQTHYHPPTHNPVMADVVDLDLVEKRCPSFAALASFVRNEIATSEVPPR